VATTQQLLDEANLAYHRLQTGVMPRVVVDVDGSRVEFTAANSGKLYSYILQLQQQIGAANGLPSSIRPAQFVF
jgi:hypothetical protein